LNINLNTNNKNHDCKIGTGFAGVVGVTSGRRRVKEVDQVDGIWLIDFNTHMKQN
jgi:hypothetical protein